MLAGWSLGTDDAADDRDVIFHYYLALIMICDEHTFCTAFVSLTAANIKSPLISWCTLQTQKK